MLTKLRTDSFALIGHLYNLFNKNKNNNVLCRWCKKEEEAIIHIFCNCENETICMLRNPLITHYGLETTKSLIDFKNPHYAINFITGVLLTTPNQDQII